MNELKVISISKEKITKLDGLMDMFCSQANTIWAILATNTGQLLVQRGFVHSFDVLAISALASGVFNSTMELARIIGERNFSEFLQEGRSYSIYYIGVDDNYLLVSLFDDRTLPGVVKVACESFADEAKTVLKAEA
ncbi:hypothetical protein A2Y85_02555 [candidate division WOR-3 bacterium RBG_13_43_14]|uniref:Roadblock/LAMTOR2 domain-containing protein n=1 Tax=candidate division WOR-3 bacterium RBG_13_43_14 TaxID=1802590 RepID=A0A1F4U8Z5_UNCW3|nr:MAG: hypothetical protein A2Y85_02555 [candidate division WOR-3 bacterium RBG_13_43_14]